MGVFGCDYHTDTEFDPEGHDTRKACREAMARDLARFLQYPGLQALRIAAQALSTLEVEGWIEFCPCDNTGKDL